MTRLEDGQLEIQLDEDSDEATTIREALEAFAKMYGGAVMTERQYYSGSSPSALLRRGWHGMKKSIARICHDLGRHSWAQSAIYDSGTGAIRYAGRACQFCGVEE